MSDEVARILSESVEEAALPDHGLLFDEKSFDEEGYLRMHPDVAQSIARGEFESGYHHFLVHGFREGRTLPGTPIELRNRLIRLQPRAEPGGAATVEVGFSVEAVLATPHGAVMLIGWVDDTSSPLKLIRLVNPFWRLVLDQSAFVRVRRGDVEKALGRTVVHRYGFIAFLHVDEAMVSGPKCSVELWLESGASMRIEVPCRQIDEIEMRNVLLQQLSTADFHGSPHVERIACLDGGLGEQIVAFNRAMTRRIVASPFVERFGPARPRFKGSIVVALYGRAEYLFVQNALFSDLPGIEDYEFIYVSNSPELGETLLREARIGSFVHGVSQTVMVLPANAGFGAANNVALEAARSGRILNVNPDVFPRDPDWAQRHTDLVESGAEGSRLFGVPLYYDDGSLMHGGMYFEADDAISTADGKMRRRRLLRVEHYGKGAPPEGTQFMRPRPVPAVTGAFISSDRAWYERLGGFTEDFVFGHYEDADLCLKSLEAGTPAWLHDIRLWHFEGKGSTRLPPHEGGSIVNRWLFSRRWNELVSRRLLGPAPPHHLISGVPEAEDLIDVEL